MDISSISTIFSTVKTATEIAQLLRDSDLSLEKAETKLKLADLIGALADVKMQLADVRELLLEKDEEIRKLQDDLKLKANVVYEKPYYWHETEEGRKGPYCPACYDDKQKLATLIEQSRGFWICCVCGKVFTDKNYCERSVPGNWDTFT